MTVWPEASAVNAGLTRLARRLVLVAAVRGASLGLVLAALVVLIGWLARWPVAATTTAATALAVAAIARAILRAPRSRRAAAARFESVVPDCRNVVVTAAQILERPEGLRDDIGTRICADAATHLTRHAAARTFPLGRSAALCLGAAALLAFVARSATHETRASLAGLVSIGAPAISRIEIVVTPPAYSGRPAETHRDPTTLSVLAGSQLALSVAATAPAVRFETVSGTASLTSGAPGQFAGALTATGDGFLSFVPAGSDGEAGPRRLVGLTVVPDQSPIVRVTAPGHDLLVADGNRQLEVGVTAADDLGLDSLRLAYTKVTGSGENFEFVRGEVPLTFTRTNDREWTGRARWSLASLALEPGDMVVYRAAATDRRPGAVPVESDAFILEVAAPGSVAAEGFAVDDQTDRYAISQRMVIVKTERLIASRASLSAEDFADQARGIAAEQRSVRAEFIFMMGGELEAEGVDAHGDLNEEAEAHGEADLLAGRARNQGRIELITATRRMSEAAALLATPELAGALKAEKAALDALQRAFSKSRYLLRALATRERLDMTRRLTGTLAGAERDRRAADSAPDDPRLATLRRSLGAIAALAGRPTYSRDDAAVAVTVGDALLRLEPGSDVMRQIATRLSEAAAAMTSHAPARVSPPLDAAVTALAAVVRAAMPAGSPVTEDARAHRLAGAIADAERKRGGR